MKPIVVGAVAALVIGLAISGPLLLVLLLMVAPLVLIVMASGWGSTHGRSPATVRRHVATPGRPR